VIRPATAGDAAQIGLVHVRSWQAAYRGLIPQDFLDHLDPAARAALWHRHLQQTDWTRAGVLVAEAGEELEGFASYGPSRDEDADRTCVGEISTLYVLAESWGQGLGRRLMAEAVEHLTAAGYTQATLWVLGTNARARRFYAAAGWSEDGAVLEDASFGFPLAEVRYRRTLADPTLA
jgi:GNAT superfamily N-acetyltransferase